MSQMADLAAHFWDKLVSRASSPLAFRFYLQPVMATALAIRDGYRDASRGRSPYLWAIIHDPPRRRNRLREGIHAVARVLILGMVMDGIYQLFVMKAFRPLELVNIVVLLAFIPYVIVQGPAERIARWWQEHHATGGPRSSYDS
jgi:hypothetical protein